ADADGGDDLLPPEPGIVAALRPGDGEPKPAGVRRDRPQSAGAGRADVGIELSPRGLPGNLGRRSPESHREPEDAPGLDRAAPRAAGLPPASERTARGVGSRGQPVERPDRVVRTRVPDAGRS